MGNILDKQTTRSESVSELPTQTTFQRFRSTLSRSLRIKRTTRDLPVEENTSTGLHVIPTRSKSTRPQIPESFRDNSITQPDTTSNSATGPIADFKQDKTPTPTHAETSTPEEELDVSHLRSETFKTFKDDLESKKVNEPSEHTTDDFTMDSAKVIDGQRNMTEEKPKDDNSPDIEDINLRETFKALDKQLSMAVDNVQPDTSSHSVNLSEQTVIGEEEKPKSAVTASLLNSISKAREQSGNLHESFSDRSSSEDDETSTHNHDYLQLQSHQNETDKVPETGEDRKPRTTEFLQSAISGENGNEHEFQEDEKSMNQTNVYQQMFPNQPTAPPTEEKKQEAFELMNSFSLN